MRSVPETEFDWIRSGRRQLLTRRDPNWTGNFVSHLFPPGFEAHVKILHPIEAKYDNIDNPLSEREIALLKIPPCTEMQALLQALREDAKGPRIRWKLLAHLLKVPFEPEICHEWFRARLQDPACWPRFLYGPDEGNLRADQLAEVLAILVPFTGSQECFFRFSEISFIGTDKPILFSGSLWGLVGFLAEGNYQFTPEYWWPIDRSWCLCSDYDLNFTFVAGPRNLISSLLSKPILETLEVNSQTRIDSLVPIPT